MDPDPRGQVDTEPDTVESLTRSSAASEPGGSSMAQNGGRGRKKTSVNATVGVGGREGLEARKHRRPLLST